MKKLIVLLLFCVAAFLPAMKAGVEQKEYIIIIEDLVPEITVVPNDYMQASFVVVDLYDANGEHLARSGGAPGEPMQFELEAGQAAHRIRLTYSVPAAPNGYVVIDDILE